MTTVALDGRGAERGPEAIVAGARAAAADGIRLRVFGDPAALAAVEGIDGAELVPAVEEITNAEEPVAAVRSQAGGLGRPCRTGRRRGPLAGDGERRLHRGDDDRRPVRAAAPARRSPPGARPPAAGPGPAGPPTLLLDVGANADARAHDLVQFAYLGAAFSQAVLGVAQPRVALLSVGEEANKGSAEVVEAHARLAGAADSTSGETSRGGTCWPGWPR